MTSEIWLTIIVVVLVVILIGATVRGWSSWKGGHGIAILTVFHDLQPRDKQHAIEIVMEQKAGKKMEEQESGQGRNPKPPSQVLNPISCILHLESREGLV